MRTERALNGGVNDVKPLLTGVVASEMGWSEEKENLVKYEAARSRHDGFASGARKAIEKSIELLGELGVTIMAGSGDFSSTNGKVRSKGAGMRV